MHSAKYDKLIKIGLFTVILSLALLVIVKIIDNKQHNKDSGIVPQSYSSADEIVFAPTELLGYVYINKDMGTNGLVGDTGKDYYIWKGTYGDKEVIQGGDREGNATLDLSASTSLFAQKAFQDYEELPIGTVLQLTPDEYWEYPSKQLLLSDDTTKSYKSTKQDAERYIKGLLGKKYILLELLQTEKGFGAILLSPEATYLSIFNYAKDLGEAVATNTTECDSILYHYNISDKPGYRIE